MRTSMPDYASFVYSTLGIAYDSLGDSSKAIEYHTKHQAIAKEVGDRAGEGRANGIFPFFWQVPETSALATCT